MSAQVAAVIEVSTHEPGAPPAASAPGVTFHDVLSALNPLQYLPVLGTIYRAVTGDTIPETVRRIGSLIVSGVMGGPIGIAINVATMAVEKITGIDLDRTGQALLHGEPLRQAVTDGAGTVGHAPAVPARAQAPAIQAAVAAPPREQDRKETTNGWSVAALAAYGVHSDRSGMLHLTGLQGADVLNTVELARLQAARSAYTRTAALGR